jgi:fumarate reductase flavoprotein subunit
MTHHVALRKVPSRPEASVAVLVVGAGACGLVAALAARDAGAEVLVLERDSLPRGSTAMSSGLIPAAGTRWQVQIGVHDDADLMTKDIQKKNHHQADIDIVRALAARSAHTLHWLADNHQIPFDLVTGFLYPGHSVLRMHGTPKRTGEELMGALLNAVETSGIDLMCDARVTTILVADSAEQRIVGVELARPDGTIEAIGCQALILASSGFGGNQELVSQFMPEMANAVYYGHTGNQGDALVWGQALGAQALDLSSYQGHGSLAWPHQTLISWSIMMQGGIQVNRFGARFSNEHDGYSEQAQRVIAQPERIAWNIYDQRIHDGVMQFEDYRQAFAASAVITADTIDELSAKADLPLGSIARTLNDVNRYATDKTAIDPLGREFVAEQRLQSPYYAIKVTGALFHTQGGLVVDYAARVISKTGAPIPGLFAGGGAARGVSGAGDSGYLSGNGLLSAVILGATAGESAAQFVGTSQG